MISRGFSPALVTAAAVSFSFLSLSRWIKYTAKLKANMEKLVKFFDKSDVQDVRLVVLEKMWAEFAHIDADYFSLRRGRDVCFDFWSCVMFRPDMAVKIQKNLSEQQLAVADVLQEAIDAAGWPEDFW